MRENHVRRTYGLSPEDVQALLAKQSGVCAICQGTMEGRKLHIDHDHAKGKVRGLLCDLCNVGLGSFKDNPERLKAAIDYLSKHA